MAIIWICIAVLLTYILIVRINRGGKFSFFGKNHTPFITWEKSIVSGDFDNYDGNITKHTFSVNEFNSIDISLSSESLYFEKGTGNEITVDLYCPTDLLPKVYVHSNTLKIESESKNIVSVNLKPRRVVVTIPSGFVADDVDINLSSGSIHISNCEFETVNCHSSSGSVHIDNCKMNKLDSKSSSGSVHVTNCEIPDLEAKSTSGSVSVSGKFDGISLQAVSGSIHADLENALVNDSELSSSSGSIHLKVPSKSDLKISYSATSGTYRNSYTGASGKRGKDIMGSGKVNLEVHSTSGSIHIN